MHGHGLRNLFRFMVPMLALAGLVFTPPVADGAVKQPETYGKTRVFHGAWFEISYPAGFTVRPSLKSRTAEGHDSAEFVSADGAVSFYVFAPQWGGDASDIALNKGREKLAGEERRTFPDREIHWFTIAARDGSYRRSYQETIGGEGSTRTILGIKYRSQQDRLRYQKAYERFKKSLKQYAD